MIHEITLKKKMICQNQEKISDTKFPILLPASEVITGNIGPRP